MHSNSHANGTAARAIALNDMAQGKPRNGFFPKAPGPGLIAFALFIGVLPSAFASVMIFGRGIDGGFYMPAEFVLSQSRWLLSVASFVTVPAVIALLYVINALRIKSHARGTLIAVILILLATVWWTWSSAMALRALLMPILSESDVTEFAERFATHPDEAIEGYRHEGGVFHVHMVMKPDDDVALLDSLPMGPMLCVPYGHLFTGPISVVTLTLTQPDGSGVTRAVEQAQCREWYLQSRVMARRPSRL